MSVRTVAALSLCMETDTHLHSSQDGALWPDLKAFDRLEREPWPFVDIQTAHGLRPDAGQPTCGARRYSAMGAKTLPRSTDLWVYNAHIRHRNVRRGC
jgi:hypothetical protein